MIWDDLWSVATLIVLSPVTVICSTQSSRAQRTGVSCTYRGDCCVVRIDERNSLRLTGIRIADRAGISSGAPILKAPDEDARQQRGDDEMREVDLEEPPMKVAANPLPERRARHVHHLTP